MRHDDGGGREAREGAIPRLLSLAFVPQRSTEIRTGRGNAMQAAAGHGRKGYIIGGALVTMSLLRSRTGGHIGHGPQCFNIKQEGKFSS